VEHPPLDIWFETPESINVGFDLLHKWYKGHKDKDLKIVIREPRCRVIEVNDEAQILDSISFRSSKCLINRYSKRKYAYKKYEVIDAKCAI
jgi:hypothetical protein